MRPGQAGFTLVEVLVAIVLLGIALMALAQLAGAQLLGSLRSHLRQAAIAAVNQELEVLRSSSYTRLALDPAQFPSTTYTDSSVTPAVTYNVVQGTSGCSTTGTCLNYTKTISAGGFSFTETRVVVGIGTSPNWNYKKVFLSLASTSGKFTYSSQTDITGATTNDPSSINTLEVDMQAVDSSGNPLTDPNNGNNPVVPPDGFNVTVTGGSGASGTTADGLWSSASLATGAYTCAVASPGGSGYQDWVTYSGLATTDSFGCTNPGTYTSKWEEVGCQAPANTSGVYNTLTVTVQNPSGTGINGVNVTLTKGNSGEKAPPGGQKTNASGVATFNNLPPGPWIININQGGYFVANGATLCAWNGTSTSTIATNLAITLDANGGGAQMATVSIPVQNSAPGGTSTMEVSAVDSTGKQYLQQQDLDAGSQSTFNVVVAGGTSYTGTYTVTLYCTGVGGSATSDGKPLTSWTTTASLASNSTWTPTGVSSTSPAAYEC